MHRIYPRMSNTYFEAGDYDKDEMIQEIGSGLLLHTDLLGWKIRWEAEFK